MAEDQELIATAQRGDLEAFNTLVLRYQDVVFRVCYRIMGDEDRAADAAQDTFITAYRRLETYNGGNFKAWLLRVATNTSYDALRYHKRRPAAALDALVSEDYDDGPPIPDANPTPEQAAQNNELSTMIQQCINALSEDQRVVVIMTDIEGYSYQEIAEIADTQLGTVKSRLSRARANLRKCLEELLPPEYRLKNYEN